MDKELKAIVDRVQKTRDLEASKTAKKPSAGLDEHSKRLHEQHELEKAYGIPKRFSDVTFESMETIGVPESIRKQFEACRKYAENVHSRAYMDGNGLILLGTYGTGKTTLAICILREAIKQLVGGLFVPMCSLVDNLYTMRALSREEFARYDKRIRQTRLLVLDDFGGEDIDKTWVLAKIDSIITERYNRQLPTIITTNYTEKDMINTYSGRVIDRIRSAYNVVEFTGPSLRRSLRVYR